MTIEIFCPTCSRSYKIGEQHIGKVVVCATKECATKFIAQVPESVRKQTPRDDFGFEIVDDEADTKITIPANIVKHPGSVDPPMAASATAPARTGQLILLARLFAYCGLLLLIAGFFFPATLPQAEGGGFSIALAITKLSTVLIGMTFTIAGAVFWTGSQSGPSKTDVTILIVMVVSAACWTFYGAVQMLLH